MKAASGSLCIAALAAMTACTEKPALSVTEKARLTAELIDGRRECRSYTDRLIVPVVAESIIAETYQAAKVAHCLKPDV